VTVPSLLTGPEFIPHHRDFQRLKIDQIWAKNNSDHVLRFSRKGMSSGK
jgi:hypothetical protein